jgi:uncharacterized protein
MPSQTSDALALPDVNVLVALLHPGHVHHRFALDWFATAGALATTPITEAGFLRLSLNPTVMGRAISPAEALASLRSVRDDPRTTFLPDAASFADPRIDLCGLVGYRQVTDLHLIDLVARNSGALVTFDRALSETLTRRDRRHVHLLG